MNAMNLGNQTVMDIGDLVEPLANPVPMDKVEDGV